MELGDLYKLDSRYNNRMSKEDKEYSKNYHRGPNNQLMFSFPELKDNTEKYPYVFEGFDGSYRDTTKFKKMI